MDAHVYTLQIPSPSPCAQSLDHPKTTKRSDSMQKQRVNSGTPSIQHTASGTGETPASSGAGYILGVEQWGHLGVC